MVKTKALVLFSGGLDSRLTIKLLQEQKLDVEALYIKLPFGCGCDLKDNSEFLKKLKIKLHILDASKGKLLKQYLRLVKSPKFSRGAGYNPCKDCKIFLFKLAKKVAKEIKAEIIATGEVIGQRPMSQMKRDLMLDEREAGLENKILRPLSAKLLPQTTYEQKGIIERARLHEISGRRRDKQIRLAKKYKIKYPNPAGGCLLCEKLLKNRFKVLLERGLDEETIRLVNVGRQFILNHSWVVLGRNADENKILENMKSGKLIEPDFIGPSVLIFGKFDKNQILDLIRSYSKSGSLQQRKQWEKYKI